MKRFITTLVFSVLVLYVCAQEKNIYRDKSAIILDLFRNNQYEKVNACFDTAMARKVTPSKLKTAWENITKHSGNFVKVNDVSEDDQPNYVVVIQNLKFEKSEFNFKLVYGKSDIVKSMAFIPSHPKDKYQLPSYYDSTKVVAKDVRIFSGEYILPGTLTLPKAKGKFPAVVLIHGSGPNDRDETVSATKMFKDIALGLTTKGIAVLRYDKRTKVYVQKVTQHSKTITVKEETMDDAIAAINSLKQNPDIDTNRIYLLGHSMGGMLLPRIAKEVPDIAGVIMMAANAQPLEDVLMQQNEYLMSIDSINHKEQIQLDTMRSQIKKIKSLTKNDADTIGNLQLLRLHKAYWIDLNTYHQIEVTKQMKVPVYILQGERDFQVTMKDFNIWKKELSDKKNVQLKSYPKLNHLFIEGEGVSVPSEYDKHGNVALEVIIDLHHWVMEKKK